MRGDHDRQTLPMGPAGFAKTIFHAAAINGFIHGIAHQVNLAMTVALAGAD